VTADSQSRQPSTRSAHRRRAAIRACSAVLRRRGFDAVTYRSVAEEGGLPEATLRAFFRTRDELRALGLEFMLNGWVQQAEEFIRRLPQQRHSLNETARLIVEVATVHDAKNWTFTRATISGIYERYLQAGKHPELRTVITNYNSVLADLVARVLALNGWVATPEGVKSVLAVVDGTVVYQLAAGQSPVPLAISLLEFAIPRLCDPDTTNQKGSQL
jgi:DNA-binding transcriptional regulator YbjK